MPDAVQNMINKMTKETLVDFCRTKSGDFAESRRSRITAQDEALFPSIFQQRFASVDIIGYFKNLEIFVFLIHLNDHVALAERSCRRQQFDFARKVLSVAHSTGYNKFTTWLGDDAPANINKALFVFTDANGNFRLSLVENLDRLAETPKRFRRQTFFVNRTQTNITFMQRMKLPWNTFDQLKETFSVEALNKEFYQKLSDWYFWAMDNVTFPETKEDKESNAVPLIRLITRFIFVWFMKQKGLIPCELFKNDSVAGMIACEKDQSSYYKAIIQNLFFATLNTEMDDPQTRVFRSPNNAAGYNAQYQIHSVFRYEDFFTENGKKRFLELAKTIPFLNGGLFSCLDTNNEVIDCFSDNNVKRAKLVVPNELFWLQEEDNKTLDLSNVYGDKKKKKELLIGLIPMLSQYNFTVDESSPNDATVALDPELLGRVFENLLASYNPETANTARKQTGSFYTPREIVDYMVEESMIQHIMTALKKENLLIAEEDIRLLVTLDELPDSVKIQKKTIIKTIESCRILDPACGSGAFPMGLLSAFTRVLEKLQPSKDDTVLYNRKLKLIQNCIYGVDIQPIAVQISKLRCFISLLADDEIDEAAENRGIEPLPNLEMHFVAANSLIDINGPEEGAFVSPKTEKIKDEMQFVAGKLFSVKRHAEKIKLQGKYAELRKDFRKELRSDFNVHDYAKIADWDPFNQMVSSSFFNPEWMFGIKNGFDIVIGNPPYIDSETMKKIIPEQRIMIKEAHPGLSGNWDIYMAFFELANKISQNIFVYITPDKWMSKPFGKTFRGSIMKNKMHSIAICGTGVFESVTVDAIISMFMNNYTKTSFFIFKNARNIEKVASTSFATLNEPYFIDGYFSRHLSILQKIEQSSISPLRTLGECEGACATHDAYILAPLLENNQHFYPDQYYKLINTGTLSKFFTRWGEREITYLGQHVLHPVIRKDSFNTSLGITYRRRAASSKIIMKGLNLLDVCLDLNAEFIPGKTTLCICSECPAVLKLLLAILNSTVAFFYFKTKIASSSYCGGITFTPDMINSFPLPQITDEEKESMITIVDDVLQKRCSIDVGQKKIDTLMFSFYHLTQEEIIEVQESKKKGGNKKLSNPSTLVSVIDSVPVEPSADDARD